MSRFAWTSERVEKTLAVAASGRAPRTYTGVSTDSRSVKPGELFVALRGERFDGADFLVAAAAAGAAGAVIERRAEDLPRDFELFVVPDALVALGQLAAERRRALDPTVVVITGTSGKTTTRELTRAVLGPLSYASRGNYNNLVGLPLSILEAPEDTGTWVLEAASNQPGEIAKLGAIAQPDLGLITSVSEGHLEGFGDLSGVLSEKLALLSHLRPGGRAFVADEPPELAREARKRCDAVVTVGLGERASVRPKRWTMSERGVSWVWRGAQFKLEGFGSHLVRDALFALAVADVLGVDSEVAAKRLAGAKVPPMRGEVRRIGELLLLVDCYNANPASFRAAIEALEGLASGRRRAALVGTMLELGRQSRALHQRVAEWLVESGIELIAATGEFSGVIADVAKGPRQVVVVADDLDAAYKALVVRLQGNEAVLLKASRGMKFERSIPLFERDFAGGVSKVSETES